MNKGIIAVVAVVGALMASSAVYAGWGWGNGGWCMTGNSPNVSTQKMRSFQKESFKARESLMDKQLELQDEYSKDVPDGRKIAALRKEIANLQDQLQATGDKYGVGNWGTGGGMNYRQSAGYGCGCGYCNW